MKNLSMALFSLVSMGLVSTGCTETSNPTVGYNMGYSAPQEDQTILVDFEDDATEEGEVLNIERMFEIDLIPTETFARTKVTTLSGLSTELAKSLVASLEGKDGIEGVELSQTYSVPNLGELTSRDGDFDFSESGYPNDPLYREGRQWNMTGIGVESAWKTTKGNKVIVAVLDTGVSDGTGKYPRVPDLKETCMVPGRNFTRDGSKSDPYDMHGHGTHVSGTIAQSTNNGIGVVGIAPEACIMPVKVLGDDGSGSTQGIADAIVWATDNGAKVINMSLGGGGHSPVLAKAVAYAAGKGVFVACAAGNDSSSRIGFPAANEGCQAISATGKSGNLSYYSNYGTNGDGIFISAPGGDKKADGDEGGVWQDTIVTNKPTQHGYFPFQGTSMATPHVAGVAALMYAQNPKATLEQVKSALANSAGKKDDKAKYGHGLLSAAGATVKMQEIVDEQSSRSLNGILALLVSFLGGALAARTFRPKR